MSKFIINNSKIRVLSDDAMQIEGVLPSGTYTLKVDPNTKELFLEKRQGFVKFGKMYGDVDKQTKRVIDTFKSRQGNTGVLLSGAKGSGKTFLVKNISYVLGLEGYSTIIIDSCIPGNVIADLLKDINSPCVVIFDEFEKVYSREDDEQGSLLPLLDGLFDTKILFLMTCNNAMRIKDELINRPGRLFYHFKFDGVSDEAIRDYCSENLENKDMVEDVVKIKTIINPFTFDIMKAIVEEMNRYNEHPRDVLKVLNVVPCSEEMEFEVELELKDKEKDKNKKYVDNYWFGNPLIKIVYIDYVDGDDSIQEKFCPENIVSIKDGLFIFETETARLRLKQRIKQSINYIDLL